MTSPVPKSPSQISPLMAVHTQPLGSPTSPPSCAGDVSLVWIEGQIGCIFPLPDIDLDSVDALLRSVNLDASPPPNSPAGSLEGKVAPLSPLDQYASSVSGCAKVASQCLVAAAQPNVVENDPEVAAWVEWAGKVASALQKDFFPDLPQIVPEMRSNLLNFKKLSRISPECLTLAYIYIGRVKRMHQCDPKTGAQVTLKKFHKLMIPALCLAQKTLIDKSYKNTRFAKLAGCTLTELNTWEREFMIMSDYNFMVGKEEFEMNEQRIRELGQSSQKRQFETAN